MTQRYGYARFHISWIWSGINHNRVGCKFVDWKDESKTAMAIHIYVYVQMCVTMCLWEKIRKADYIRWLENLHHGVRDKKQMCVCSRDSYAPESQMDPELSLPQMKTRACIVFCKHCWAHVPSGVEKREKKAQSHSITSTNCTSQVKMPHWINVCIMAKVHWARMWHVCHSMATTECVHYNLLKHVFLNLLKLLHWPSDHHAAHLQFYMAGLLSSRSLNRWRL